MTDLLRCHDRWGREVRLTEACWHDHILPQRKVLRGLESRVAVVLADPYRVMSDATSAVRECFYRHGVIPGYDRLLLKVVVEFRPMTRPEGIIGSVVTAYPTDRFKRGERQLWP